MPPLAKACSIRSPHSQFGSSHRTVTLLAQLLRLVQHPCARAGHSRTLHGRPLPCNHMFDAFARTLSGRPSNFPERTLGSKGCRRRCHSHGQSWPCVPDPIPARVSTLCGLDYVWSGRCGPCHTLGRVAYPHVSRVTHTSLHYHPNSGPPPHAGFHCCKARSLDLTFPQSAPFAPRNPAHVACGLLTITVTMTRRPPPPSPWSSSSAAPAVWARTPCSRG